MEGRPVLVRPHEDTGSPAHRTSAVGWIPPVLGVAVRVWVADGAVSGAILKNCFPR